MLRDIATSCMRSVLAVAAQFLPGDWGFFVPYLTGGKQSCHCFAHENCVPCEASCVFIFPLHVQASALPSLPLALPLRASYNSSLGSEAAFHTHIAPMSSDAFFKAGVEDRHPFLVHCRFSSIYPDYRERVLRHEAAHLLAGYLFGVPVTAYSLDLGVVPPI